VRRAILAWFRLAAVLVIGIVLQTTVVAGVAVLGVHPDLMLLAAVSAGLVGGGEQGAVVGFGAGLLADLFLPTTPLGLSALAYCVTGFAAGAPRGRVLSDGRLMAPAVCFVGSVAGVLLFVVAGVVMGQTQLLAGGPARLARTAALVGTMHALLAPPATRIVARAGRGSVNSSDGGEASRRSVSASERPRTQAGQTAERTGLSR